VKVGLENYGKIDWRKIAAAGQSCITLETYLVSYRDDLTSLLSSGIIDYARKSLLKDMEASVVFFLRGSTDTPDSNGTSGYVRLKACRS
jgi:hypothetical protein